MYILCVSIGERISEKGKRGKGITEKEKGKVGRWDAYSE
jgi:hypothetical protein